MAGLHIMSEVRRPHGRAWMRMFLHVFTQIETESKAAMVYKSFSFYAIIIFHLKNVFSYILRFCSIFSSLRLTTHEYFHFRLLHSMHAG